MIKTIQRQRQSDWRDTQLEKHSAVIEKNAMDLFMCIDVDYAQGSMASTGVGCSVLSNSLQPCGL